MIILSVFGSAKYSLRAKQRYYYLLMEK